MVHIAEPTIPSKPEADLVGWRQRWLAWSITATLIAVGLAVTPFADTALVVVPTFYAMFAAAMFVINLMLAALLFIKGSIQKRGDAIRLGTAYLFVTLTIILQLASAPDGFMPSPLIGLPQTPVWMWFFWHVGFGIAIIRYAWFAGQPTPPGSSVLVSVFVAVASSIAAAYVASTCTDILPTILVNSRFLYGGPALLFWGPATAVTVAALVAVARLDATSPERLWLVVGLVASCLELWLKVCGTARFTAGWYLGNGGSLTTSVVVLLAVLQDIISLYAAAERNNEVLRNLARRDGLTGISNRRHFDELLDEEFRRARRQESPLALVLLDIDFFKDYNDRYGHQVGDESLRRVCATVQTTLQRPGDHVARYGGEELAILLPATDGPGAMVIAESARQAVQALGIAHAGSAHGVVTVSAGISWLLPLRNEDTLRDLVSGADRALYRAKKNGRNMVESDTSNWIGRATSLVTTGDGSGRE